MFFCVSMIDKRYTINKIEKMIFTIFIWIVLCEVCFHYAIPCTSDIFLMFVFLLFIDVLYQSYFLDKDFFAKEEKSISYYIFLIIIGFFINQEFINKVSSVFLTGDEFRGVFWLLMIVFLFRFGTERKMFSSSSFSDSNKMSSEYILVQYTKLRYRFGRDIEFKTKELSSMVYALMIFYNHKRSKLLRCYDYFMFRMTGNRKKLGIMQVESNHFITDAESISIVYEKLKKQYDNLSSIRGMKRVESILKDYAKEDYEDILSIFEIIQKF